MINLYQQIVHRNKNDINIIDCIYGFDYQLNQIRFILNLTGQYCCNNIIDFISKQKQDWNVSVWRESIIWFLTKLLTVQISLCIIIFAIGKKMLKLIMHKCNSASLVTQCSYSLSEVAFAIYKSRKYHIMFLNQYGSN